MKKLMIATSLCVMFTLLSIFSAKADGRGDRDHGRDRREWRDHDRRNDRDEWRDRREDRREWRGRERFERPRYYEGCRPHVYFHY